MSNTKATQEEIDADTEENFHEILANHLMSAAKMMGYEGDDYSEAKKFLGEQLGGEAS